MKRFLTELGDLTGKTITGVREHFVWIAIHFGDEVAVIDCEAGWPELCTDEGMGAQSRIALGITEAQQFFADKSPWPPGVMRDPGEESAAYIETKSGRRFLMDGDWIGTTTAGDVVNYGQLKI